jgi:hypothetical protein
LARLTLVSRGPRALEDAAPVNAWLEEHAGAERVAPGHYVVDVTSADVATQAEVLTARDGEPLPWIVVDMPFAGIPYGAPLVIELRRLCEALAAEFDLAVETSSGIREVDAFFDDGSL